MLISIPDAGRTETTFSAAQVADRILEGTDGHVVVGPIRRRPIDGPDRRFLVATFKVGGFHLETVSMQGPDDGVRRDIVAALLRHPAVVHDANDELVMAQICANRWPCAETAELLDLARRHYGAA